MRIARQFSSPVSFGNAVADDQGPFGLRLGGKRLALRIHLKTCDAKHVRPALSLAAPSVHLLRLRQVDAKLVFPGAGDIFDGDFFGRGNPGFPDAVDAVGDLRRIEPGRIGGRVEKELCLRFGIAGFPGHAEVGAGVPRLPEVLPGTPLVACPVPRGEDKRRSVNGNGDGTGGVKSRHRPQQKGRECWDGEFHWGGTVV